MRGKSAAARRCELQERVPEQYRVGFGRRVSYAAFAPTHQAEAKETGAEEGDLPEPTSLPLFATGLGLMGWLAWRRRRGLAACRW